MRITAIFLFLFFLTTDLICQNRIIQGRVVEENLESIPFVNIKIKDSIIGQTDLDGYFKIHIPRETDKLLFQYVGLEPSSIILKNECDTIELIMMYFVSYDFMSLKKADRLRLKRFKKLSELHQDAYNQGIFLTKIACYEQKFYYYNPKNE